MVKSRWGSGQASHSEVDGNIRKQGAGRCCSGHSVSESWTVQSKASSIYCHRKPVYLIVCPCLWDSVIGLSFKCAQNPCFEVKSWTQGSWQRQCTRSKNQQQNTKRSAGGHRPLYKHNMTQTAITAFAQPKEKSIWLVLTDEIILCCHWNRETRILEWLVKLLWVCANRSRSLVSQREKISFSGQIKRNNIYWH